jgi:ElaB/YqjD/DUF883 family membrane-anchored ribosome-binding protein
MSSMGRTGNGLTPDNFDDGSEPAERLGERLEYLEEEAEDAAREGLDTLRGGLGALADEGNRAFEMIERNVEEHPWISMAVGFGIGCLLGAIVLRRD